MFTADSARFISPKPRTIITGNSVVCEIEPRMPVDSVKLFVRHSQNRIDTLGTITSPPYRAVWNCEAVPDQDPAHLQFGYILYTPKAIITSPAMPHHWALMRGGRAPSKERYRIRQQTAHAAFPLDGDRAKWERAISGRIGDAKRNIGEFRMIWTGARLYFTAWVNDSSITPGDFVELHLDMHSDPADFPGMTHRSLRFGPLTRSVAFIGEYVEGKGYVSCDSIGLLFRDEMVWRSVIDPNGKWYTIEAAIPHSLLSGFDLPPKTIGMDVTVMNVDRVTRGGNAGDLFGDDDDFDIDDDGDNMGGDLNRGDGDGDTVKDADTRPARRVVNPIGAMIGRIEHDTSFYSWAGAGRFTRYSPSSWGTARFTHATTWFRILFFMLITLAIAFPLLNIIQTFTSGHKEAKEDKLMDEDNYSPITEAVIECVEKRLADADFGLKDVLQSIDGNEEEVVSALQKDLGITFCKLLTVRRIKRSQGLMKDPGLDIEKIAARCGFADVNTYREQYTAQMNVDPEISRTAVQDRIREDREMEEEDDDD
jgi:AraC-like DNA-binding protein